MVRLRILHVASADLWGGAEAQLDSLCGASIAVGLEPSAVLLNPGSELARRLRARGIAVLELDESRSSAPRLLRAVLAHARRLRPHVIHTHRFKENIIGGTAARLCGAGSIRTLHGAPEPELLKGSWRRRLLDSVDAFAARHFQSHVVAVSDELKRKVTPQFPGARIVVVPNGVDVAQLRAAAGTADESPVARLAFFGRLVPVKRVDLLLAAAAETRDLAVPFELDIVGDGPERARLEAESARLGLGERVRFRGFQPDAAAWMNRMDAVVLTSDHEGLPMVVLEALALGVPMVARAVGGIPEVLRAVNPQWLIDGDSPRAIAECLAQVLARRGPRAARASLLPARYSAEAMALNYLSLYQVAAAS